MHRCTHRGGCGSITLINHRYSHDWGGEYPYPERDLVPEIRDPLRLENLENRKRFSKQGNQRILSRLEKCRKVTQNTGKLRISDGVDKTPGQISIGGGVPWTKFQNRVNWKTSPSRNFIGSNKIPDVWYKQQTYT